MLDTARSYPYMWWSCLLQLVATLWPILLVSFNLSESVVTKLPAHAFTTINHLVAFGSSCQDSTYGRSQTMVWRCVFSIVKSYSMVELPHSSCNTLIHWAIASTKSIARPKVQVWKKKGSKLINETVRSISRTRQPIQLNELDINEAPFRRAIFYVSMLQGNKKRRPAS